MSGSPYQRGPHCCNHHCCHLLFRSGRTLVFLRRFVVCLLPGCGLYDRRRLWGMHYLELCLLPAIFAQRHPARYPLPRHYLKLCLKLSDIVCFVARIQILYIVSRSSKFWVSKFVSTHITMLSRNCNIAMCKITKKNGNLLSDCQN